MITSEPPRLAPVSASCSSRTAPSSAAMPPAKCRLWTLGATSHSGNNNRWAREGGVIDEILHRNPEGNPLILDTILLEKVVEEPNIRLLLNTAVHDLEMSGPGTISAVRAWCSQNSTTYLVKAPLFCDASGDGVLGFLAGAAFRMGAEARMVSDFLEGPHNFSTPRSPACSAEFRGPAHHDR
jgi:hypothetical protein